MPISRIVRARNHSMRVGQRVRMTGLTAEVVSLTSDERPAEALFEFDLPLDDSSLLLVQWRDGRYVRFEPPPVGETVLLEAALPLLAWAAR